MSITFVTDPAFGGVGVFVDDTKVVAGGATLDAEGFEAGLGAWSAQPPPMGSYQGGSSFVRSQALLAAGVSTRDTVLLGFGIEQLATPAERSAVLGQGGAVADPLIGVRLGKPERAGTIVAWFGSGARVR